MLDYEFFLHLAIILISTKTFGLLSRRFAMPQVVGALVAGLILGPSVLNIIHETEFINTLAELGVIILMFIAGVETDMKEMKNTGRASLVIAVFGVVIPLAGGFIITAIFNNDLHQMSKADLLENFFVGVILTATSVSITVETLREMGKLRSPAGTAILAAAIIDDILGIIILTIITSFKDSSVSITMILTRIALFFVFALGLGLIMNKMFHYLSNKYGKKRRIPIYGFVLALLLSYIAEHFFGVADITGAYLAGVIISNIGMKNYISEKAEIMSYMLLGPVFFASIGIKTVVESMDWKLLIFSLLLLVVAIGTKILGCGLGAKLAGFSKADALRIGVGMISRGEVALIVTNKGAMVGLVKQEHFAPIVLVVIVTTLITPVLLKMVFSHSREKAAA